MGTCVDDLAYLVWWLLVGPAGGWFVACLVLLFWLVCVLFSCCLVGCWLAFVLVCFSGGSVACSFVLLSCLLACVLFVCCLVVCLLACFVFGRSYLLLVSVFLFAWCLVSVLFLLVCLFC